MTSTAASRLNVPPVQDALALAEKALRRVEGAPHQ